MGYVKTKNEYSLHKRGEFSIGCVIPIDMLREINKGDGDKVTFELKKDINGQLFISMR